MNLYIQWLYCGQFCFFVPQLYTIFFSFYIYVGSAHFWLGEMSVCLQQFDQFQWHFCVFMSLCHIHPVQKNFAQIIQNFQHKEKERVFFHWKCSLWVFHIVYVWLRAYIWGVEKKANTHKYACTHTHTWSNKSRKVEKRLYCILCDPSEMRCARIEYNRFESICKSLNWPRSLYLESNVRIFAIFPEIIERIHRNNRRSVFFIPSIIDRKM